jgi:hypothetical protein
LSTSTPFSAITRPRSIGTLTSVPSGACLPTSAEKASTSLLWMSTKKKFGARSGRLPEICRLRLPSISASVTRSVSPRPSDSTTDGVKAPGRWMLPMASLSAVERTRGLLLAAHCTSAPTTRSTRKARMVAPTKIEAMRRSPENRTASAARSSAMPNAATM